MSQKELNLGILAHVDAGKTTLTERLLYEAGVIGEIGSVDRGTTQTDFLALERERGITIRSAVASFALDGVHVNLIDTPGHPDFIAEVERVLNVLDGAVLVLSAVEGVQPQTRILMRALQRLRVPTLLFVNKVDRPGADVDQVTNAIRERLTTDIVLMETAGELGTRAANVTPFDADDPRFRSTLSEVLVENDERLLPSYVEDEKSLTDERLAEELVSQTGRVLVHPVFFGSAVTGAGIRPLMRGITKLLPSSDVTAAGPPLGLVFKIERGPSGEKIAYVRMFSGELHSRHQLRFGADHTAKVTRLAVFEGGTTAVQRPSVAAGAVAKLWGLTDVQVGDRVGTPGNETPHQFSPPTLESVVVPNNPADRARLATALVELGEQDPLIGVRMSELDHELSVSLYGQVQQEVIAATLNRDYGIEVSFHEPTPLCVERVGGVASATEDLGGRANPFLAGVGFRVEPAARGSGVSFSTAVDLKSIPIYVYKSVPAFETAMEQYVRGALEEGVLGWRVTDCLVTLTHCEYSPPGTSARDYRLLTPLVLMQAVADAGTRVCEPFVAARIEAPSASASGVLGALSRLRSSSPAVAQRGDVTVISSRLPATELSILQRQLPGMSSGEGLIEAEFAGYEPVAGAAPRRARRMPNPLNRDDYLMQLAGRAKGRA